jgi:hypothetical protein
MGAHNYHVMGYRQRYVSLLQCQMLNYFTIISTEFIAANPQYVSPNNSMDFLSDNGGQTYNLCHCELTKLLFTANNTDTMFQIGAISRSQIWSSGEVRPILNSLTSWNPKAVSTMRYAGASTTVIRITHMISPALGRCASSQHCSITICP